MSKDADIEITNNLEKVRSDQQGTIEPVREGEYKRTISNKQLHVISLGSNIGSGLFIATGKGIADAGAAGAVIAYTLVTTCVAAVLQVLGEMTIAFPVSGNFIDYAHRFVHPSIAFAAGFAEWLGWCAVLGSEATFFNVVIRNWTQSVPEAVWLSIFIAGSAILFCLPNVWFARFEYITSFLKVTALTLLIILDFALIMGAGPEGRVHHGETWTEGPVFKNGFQGFATASLLALWAYSDQVFIGIMGGEAESPRFAIARAAKTVPVRVALMYLLTIIFSSLLVGSDDQRLFGGSGTSQSPFAIAMQDAGITGLDSFLGAVILLSCFGFGAESIYIASRLLRALSHQKLIPGFIAGVDSKGRPVKSLVISGTIALVLTYLNLSGTGITVFDWLVSITSSSFFIVWIVVSISSWRFHEALKAQQDPLFTEIFAWQAWRYPLPTAWLFLNSVLLFVCCIYAGIYPLGSTSASVYNFFSYNIGVVIVLVFTFVHKLWYKTEFRRAEEVDLRTGRRTLGEVEIEMLRKYYAQPAWRRMLSYFEFF